MGRWPWIVALLCACLLATVAVAGAASTGPAAPGATHAEQSDGLATQADREFESLQLRLHVLPSGDVIWTYRYIYPVESEAEKTAFEDYADRFESEETDLYRDFRNQSESLTESASERLGREMTATDYERAAEIDTTPTREVGEVELSYRWTNFGRVVDGSVHVGDVFEGGFYLDAGQSLVFRAGENLTFESVAPEDSASTATVGDSQSVTWSGEQRFPDGHPRATLAIQNDGSGGADASDDDATSAMSGPMLLGGGILLLVLALLAVAVVRDDLPALHELRTSASEPGTTSDPRQEPAPDAGSGDVGTAAETDATADAEEEPEVLSDEQRVRALLEEHDGRMKQSAIVEETEWSKSKVSMLLSDMEDEEIISKIQVGRENIIALQGNEPEAASSPFDDSE